MRERRRCLRVGGNLLATEQRPAGLADDQVQPSVIGIVGLKPRWHERNGGPGIVAEHRAALERDIIDAVGRAMLDVVTASARMLEGLQDSPEMRSVRDALEKEIGRRNRDPKAVD